MQSMRIQRTSRTKLQAMSLECRITPAVNITLDYSLDGNGFFTDPSRRAIVARAATDLSSRLGDTLTAITPGGGNTWRATATNPTTGGQLELTSPTIAQGQILLYLGARNLSGSTTGIGTTGGFSSSGSTAFLDSIERRGQGPTTGAGATDFAPWGGSISFDTGTNWYFNTDPAGIGDAQTDFYSVAIHELGHVLGLGTAESWDNKISGGTFRGAFSRASNGGNVLLSSDLGHWDESVRSGGLQPSLTPVLITGTITRFTALDFAGLADIGWNVSNVGNGGGTTPPPVVPPVLPAPPVAPSVTYANQHLIATGTESGSSPHVRVFDANGIEKYSFFAYDANFLSGVRVATGDVDGDGIDDIVTAPGVGGGPHIKVYSGATGNVLQSFFAYDPAFTKGVYVALGDVNGDGRKDIITGAGPGGGPHVKVTDAVTLATIHSFFAYDPNFGGGVNVASGDIDGDGFADIITGVGPGGGPNVKAISGKNLSTLRSFFAYDPGFSGGVFVSAGDFNRDGLSEIVTTAGPGGGPHVQVLQTFSFTSTIGEGNRLLSFFAGSPTLTTGIRVATDDINGDGYADLITTTGSGTPTRVTVYSGLDLSILRSITPYDPAFGGGAFVG